MSKPGFPVARRAAGVLSVAGVLTLAACSSGTASPTSTPPAPKGPSATSSTTVGTTSVSVNGTQTTALTTPDGHTLYYFTDDNASGKPTCTSSGGCTAIWPPLIATAATGGSGVTGTLTIVNGPNGSQVVYDNHPLYTFAGEQPGQATGQAMLGKWFVATPALAAGAGPAGPSGPSPTGSTGTMSSSPSTNGSNGGYNGGGY